MNYPGIVCMFEKYIYIWLYKHVAEPHTNFFKAALHLIMSKTNQTTQHTINLH